MLTRFEEAEGSVRYGPEKLSKDDLLDLLTRMRIKSKEQQESGGPVSSFQLKAQFSLAYTCGVAPTAWEVMVSPGFFVNGRTDFLGRHYDEIAEALAPKLTFELLQTYVVEKDRSLLLIDPDRGGWRTVEAANVEWFPSGSNARKSRSVYAKALNRTSEEHLERAQKDVGHWTQRCASDPTENNLRKLREAEFRVKRWQRGDAEFLQAEARRRQLLRDEVAALDSRDTTKPNFAEALAALIRETENEVRARYGIAVVGGGWVSETELCHRIQDLLPGVEVIHHGQPHWLGRQHLDVWIPSLSVAVEYHGAQHFQAVEFFGGEDAFRKNQERDQRKRALCKQNGIRLMEISWDQGYIEDAELVEMLQGRK